MERSNDLYARVVEITSYYLGPAAERFVNRQVNNHLKKEPEALRADDLKQLIDWLKAAMVFLTDDEEVVSHYVNELKTLSRIERQGKNFYDEELGRSS